jgi:polar amino acid transport system substrate-binding protein
VNKAFFLLFFFFFSTSYANDKLKEILSNELIHVGVKYDYKPFGFIDKRGRLVGFDVELARFIADKLNVSVKFHQVTSESRVPMLLKKEVDLLIASMTHTLKLDEKIDFSMPYFFDGQSLLVRENERAMSYKDFDNRKVGAVRGATSGPHFEKLVPKANVVYFSEYHQALRALKRKNVDALTTDYTWCMVHEKDSKGKFKVIGDTFSFEPYAMGVLQNQSSLRDAINKALVELVKEGIYTELYEKWFEVKPTRLPLAYP